MTFDDCSHRPPCPGCPRYGDVSIAAGPLALLTRLADSAGIAAPQCVTGAGLASRYRARLMVRGRARSPKVGIFEAGSHRIVDIPSCGIHHPLINEVARILKSTLHTTGVRPYVDESHQGLVRAIQVVVDPLVDRTDRTVERAQVVVVTNDTTPDSARPLLDALCNELARRLHSLHWNGQPDRSNAIIGPYWQTVFGPEALEQEASGVRVFYPPGAFGQSNSAMATRLIQQLYEWIPAGARIAEFYAGVGAIGLGLVERASLTRMNELGAHSLAGLRAGVDALAPQLRAKVEVYPGDATACVAMLDGCDTAIVDPPRRGLDAAVCDALARWSGERIVYVSCGIDSYLTDCEQLRATGRWRLAEQIAYGFFPFTEHVETLARFERV
jgi:23S rRNA (uracil1939-C5)-methyltransferase